MPRTIEDEIEALREENEALLEENALYQERLSALKQLARAPIEADDDEEDDEETD